MSPLSEPLPMVKLACTTCQLVYCRAAGVVRQRVDLRAWLAAIHLIRTRSAGPFCRTDTRCVDDVA